MGVGARGGIWKPVIDGGAWAGVGRGGGAGGETEAANEKGGGMGVDGGGGMENAGEEGAICTLFSSYMSTSTSSVDEAAVSQACSKTITSGGSTRALVTGAMAMAVKSRAGEGGDTPMGGGSGVPLAACLNPCTTSNA